MPRTGRHPARRVRLPPALRHVHLNAAGIDVGAGSHHVAIPPGRDPEGRNVREGPLNLGRRGYSLLAPTRHSACRVYPPAPFRNEQAEGL